MHRLLLKLPDAEFDYIKSNAAKMNIPMSTFVRLAITGQLKSPEIEKPEKEKPLTEKPIPSTGLTPTAFTAPSRMTGNASATKRSNMRLGWTRQFVRVVRRASPPVSRLSWGLNVL